MRRVGIAGVGLVTPLGNSPAGVLASVRAGKSALALHPGFPEPYYASLLPREEVSEPFFEQVSLEAARRAVEDAGIDPADPATGFVLSSIKGDIEHFGQNDVSLAYSAGRIARALGVQTSPVVVSNACISGLAALVQGMRMIRAGQFKRVIVVGTELQSPFIVTGFQSLKALSVEPCKPFDAHRVGLNLGEASAAIVLTEMMGAEENYFLCSSPKNQFSSADDVQESACHSEHSEESMWEIVEGAIRNDANHISGPSRTGEGSFNALRAVLPFVDKKDLAFVNVHGTATVYNDEMEAIALSRAGLLDVPVNALKGYFGHTMGAAGILESILSMQALEAGVVLATRGFSELGVSAPVKVSAQEQPAVGNSFIKLLSGFGGVNGALLFRKGGSL